MTLENAALLLQGVSCFYMTGVVWIIHRVHYPSFPFVEPGRFAEFESFHVRRTGIPIGLPMCVEMGSALLLPVLASGSSRWISGLGLMVLVGIWGVTFLHSVPCHRRLEQGFSLEFHRRLMSGNAWRTAGWSLRSVLVLVLLSQALGRGT